MIGMYFAEITVIDGATINENGWLVGQSVNPGAHLFGSLLSEEQVIADFSSAKKHIKKIIDDKMHGFDHKLWIFSNSNCDISLGKNKGETTINTPLFEACVPENGVVFLRRATTNFSDVSSIVCKYLDVYVLNELKRRWPDKYAGLEKIEFSNGNHMSFVKEIDAPTTFRYTHGLAKSTSWGCQLIAHGHLSYVVVNNKDGTRNWQLESMIAQFLDSTYIVSNEHILNIDNKQIHIAYESMSRGKMSLSLKAPCDDIYITDDEPTIENIVKAVVEDFKHEINNQNVASVYISEGSNKGALWLA